MPANQTMNLRRTGASAPVARRPVATAGDPTAPKAAAPASQIVERIEPTALLTLTPVKMRRRGRAEPPMVPQLGHVIRFTDGSEVVDIEPLRDVSVVTLAEFATSQHINPSLAMVTGINQYLEQSVRTSQSASFAARLVSEGLVNEPEAARVLAMHLRGLAKMSDRSDDEMIEVARQLLANAAA